MSTYFIKSYRQSVLCCFGLGTGVEAIEIESNEHVTPE